jgi:2-amino-4-hydroxy-6-hydroxymethyldihydropteridine diphosphokinase
MISNSLFIALGSNLGNRLGNLQNALVYLEKKLNRISSSSIYESPAVDYLNQPDFYNQVIEFSIPSMSASETMLYLLDIEKEMGRNRLIPKGPRLIDLDILFWGLEKINTEIIQTPHPRLFERSFVVIPLSELPGFHILKNYYSFATEFQNSATKLSTLT